MLCKTFPTLKLLNPIPKCYYNFCNFSNNSFYIFVRNLLTSKIIRTLENLKGIQITTPLGI